MNSRGKELFSLTVLVVVLFSSVTHGHGTVKPFPHVGKFYYDGGTGIEVRFTFHNPGGWKSANPGFELDVTLLKDFFQSAYSLNNACRSWTDLTPGYAYDDCPTSGYFENDSTRETFGFGTYNAREIKANYEYWARFSFTNDQRSLTDYSVSWQEVYRRDNCPHWDPVWCMIGAGQGGTLTDRVSYLQKGITATRRWTWTDRYLAQGGWAAEPEGTSYCSVNGYQVGELYGPDGSNDFDLYLFKKNSSGAWQQVASSNSSENQEKISYPGGSGCYLWNVNAYRGSGVYRLTLDYPSPTSTAP